MILNGPLPFLWQPYFYSMNKAILWVIKGTHGMIYIYIHKT